MFESSKGEFPIVFPEHIEHSFIAHCVKSVYPSIKLTSAGFCNHLGNVWGHSVSLKLKCDTELDPYYIKKMLEVD